MVDKIYTIEELDNIPLYKLRLILRDMGGTPGNKTVGKIKEEIMDIQSGKILPTPTKRGRKPKSSDDNPITFNDSGAVDLGIPTESTKEPLQNRGNGSDYVPAYSAESYYEDGVSAPYSVQVRDVEAEEPIKIIVASGVLEVRNEGYGFLRTITYGDKRKDYYVEKQIIKTYALRTGDYVVGHAINKNSPNSFSLCEVMKINGIPREAYVRGYDYDSTTAVFPNQSLISPLEEEKTARVIDLVAPVALGQRGLIVAPPKTGKTTLLKNLAQAISNEHPNAHLMLLLIDERPEEVTDFEQGIFKCELIASTFDQSPAHHIFHAEMAIERAKRLVESGNEVVILMDSITKLTRAYNLVVPSTGKTLSGGLELEALVRAKKLFGSARKLREGGSLTIIATALVDTGSRMDDLIYEEFKGTGNMEIHLSRELAQRRVFPAVDILQSGTRKEELIFTEDKLIASRKIRKLFEVRNNVTETLIEMIRLSKNNEDLIRKLDGWLKAILE